MNAFNVSFSTVRTNLHQASSTVIPTQEFAMFQLLDSKMLGNLLYTQQFMRTCLSV